MTEIKTEDERVETPFSRSRYLRHVPPVEGDLSTRRHWIILRDPGCTPEKKGPFSWGRVDDFIREVIACRPAETQITVVSLTWDFDVWVEDGRCHIAETEILASVDWEEVDHHLKSERYKHA